MTSSPSLTRLIDILGDVSPVVELVAPRCLRRRLHSHTCHLCLDVCPTQALTLKDREVYLDSSQCSGCMRCQAVCPNEALISPYTPELTAHCFLGKDRVLVSCVRNRNAGDGDCIIPCVGMFSPLSLMVLAMGGSKTILFNMSSCADCVNHGVVDTFMAALDRVAPLSDQLSGGRLIATDNLSRYGTRSRRDRRAFLVSLYQRLSALAGQKPSCFSPEPTVPPHSLRRIPWHIRQAMQMYESTPFEVREQLLALCAYQLEIKPTCTLCPRCAGICPTGALKFERLGTGKQVLFNARQCSGCGLCVAFCPSQAVALNAPLLCAL